MKIEACPKCGSDMVTQEWHDDHGIIEIHKSCSCGYLYHWAYGTVIDDSEQEETK